MKGFPTNNWRHAAEAYLVAKEAEHAYDNGPYADAIRAADAQGEMATFDERLTQESDRLTDIRAAAEDALMAIPSPDAASFAFKYLVARGSGRETDCWDAMLEAEATRFAYASSRTAEDPDALLHDAWREFVQAKLADPERTVDAHRVREVDRIIFDRDAETIAGVAIKVRAALYISAVEDWLESAALSLPGSHIDARLKYEDTPIIAMWSAIRSLERLHPHSGDL